MIQLRAYKFKLNPNGSLKELIDKTIGSCRFIYNCMLYKKQEAHGNDIKDFKVFGFKNVDLKLSDRYWECTSCNTVLDRDLNAGLNILDEGLILLNKRRNDGVSSLNNHAVCGVPENPPPLGGGSSRYDYPYKKSRIIDTRN